MKVKGLGKGLAALIPGGTASASDSSGLLLCPVENIRPNPCQMREMPTESSLTELAASIREKGLLEPLLVRRARGADGYELIAGERRWRAAQMAGLGQVPVLVREADDRESLELALIENVQREDLNPMEEARAYRRLASEFGLTQADIAQRTGKDRSTVANALRLLKLPAPLQEAVADGRLTPGHARAILALPTQEQLRAGKLILIRGLSVRQAEQLSKQKVPSSKKARTSATDPDLAAIINQLQEFFGTRVRITPTEKGGRIEIDYYGPEDLERILERIAGQE